MCAINYVKEELDLITDLTAVTAEVRGSYVFVIPDINYRPDWLIGYSIVSGTIRLTKDWCKFTALLTGGEETVLFEGSLPGLDMLTYLIYDYGFNK